MGLFSSILVTAACVAAAFHFWDAFGHTDAERKAIRRWLFEWSMKGIVVPLSLWMLFNSGLIPGLPSLSTDLEVARAEFARTMNLTGARLATTAAKATSVASLVAEFLRVSGNGLALISSFWTALTLFWLWITVRRFVPEENRDEFKRRSILWLCLAAPIAALGFWSGGLASLGFSVAICLVPMLHTGMPLLDGERKAPPVWTRVVGKIKLGKFEDAEMEIIRELEKCEDDFEGWMMLADLYANHFNDLEGAAQTIHDLCNQPATHPSQMAVALHKLADWHLKLAEDPDAARAELEEICRRVPRTHLARMARLRIAQLPLSKEDLVDHKGAHPVRMPALSDDFDQRIPSGSEGSERERAIAHSQMLVQRLERDPDDVKSREELAYLFAEKLGRVDTGIEQLELLTGMPDQPRQKIAEWIGRMASWHMRFEGDEDAARQLLQRIIDNFPDTFQAGAARRRLMLMDVEKQMKEYRAAEAAKPRRVIRVEP